MAYNKEELIEVFENSGIIAKVTGGYIINKSFQTAIKDKRSSHFCQNYPSSLKGLSDALIYNRFMEACEIPVMSTGDLTYFVRTESKESVRKLKTILKNPELDYERLVHTFKNFYASTSAMPGFAKFICTNSWEALYNDRTEKTTAERDRKGTI